MILAMTNVIEFPRTAPAISELDMALAELLYCARALMEQAIADDNQSACAIGQQVVLAIRCYEG